MVAWSQTFAVEVFFVVLDWFDHLLSFALTPLRARSKNDIYCAKRPPLKPNYYYGSLYQVHEPRGRRSLRLWHEPVVGGQLDELVHLGDQLVVDLLLGLGPDVLEDGAALQPRDVSWVLRGSWNTNIIVRSKISLNQVIVGHATLLWYVRHAMMLLFPRYDAYHPDLNISILSLKTANIY